MCCSLDVVLTKYSSIDDNKVIASALNNLPKLLEAASSRSMQDSLTKISSDSRDRGIDQTKSGGSMEWINVAHYSLLITCHNDLGYWSLKIQWLRYISNSEQCKLLVKVCKRITHVFESAPQDHEWHLFRGLFLLGENTPQ